MRIILTALLITCSSLPAFGQQANKDSSLTAKDTTETTWELEADVYDYILPGESDNLLALFYADYGAIHFEGRYNYEDRNTASVFGGYRFETGKQCVLGVTPIIGVVFGNTSGAAPGLLVDLAYGKFDFYSESEYVLDFTDKDNNFIYTWTELAITPVENIRVGLSANRTRIVQTELEIQRGIFAQYSMGNLTAGMHFFNPFRTDHFFIATLGYEF